MMENDRFSPPTTILPHRLRHHWGTPSSSASPIPHPQPSLPVANGRDLEWRDLVPVQLHEGEGGGASCGRRVRRSASSARRGGSSFTLLYRPPIEGLLFFLHLRHAGALRSPSTPQFLTWTAGPDASSVVGSSEFLSMVSPANRCAMAWTPRRVGEVLKSVIHGSSISNV